MYSTEVDCESLRQQKREKQTVVSNLSHQLQLHKGNLGALKEEMDLVGDTLQQCHVLSNMTIICCMFEVYKFMYSTVFSCTHSHYLPHIQYIPGGTTTMTISVYSLIMMLYHSYSTYYCIWQCTCTLMKLICTSPVSTLVPYAHLDYKPTPYFDLKSCRRYFTPMYYIGGLIKEILDYKPTSTFARCDCSCWWAYLRGTTVVITSYISNTYIHADQTETAVD